MSRTITVKRKGLTLELDYEAVGDLLKSKEMETCLMDNAKKIAVTAGAGYKAKQMDTRVIVVPDTQAAEQDNYENNTLLKGISR